MKAPDLTKLEDAVVSHKSLFTSVFLHGVIKRPITEEKRLMSCAWCDQTHDYFDVTPDGWLKLGSGSTARHCCPLCIPNVMPDYSDE